ncbi:MAG: hypothetical protein ACRD1T_10035 [Acidimicrobiia bacterium]
MYVPKGGAGEGAFTGINLRNL